MGVKIEYEDRALLLLHTLPESYDNFMDNMLYGRIMITLQDIKTNLNLKELKKEEEEEVGGYHGELGEDLITRENRETRLRSRTRPRIKKGREITTLKEIVQVKVTRTVKMTKMW